MTAVSNLGSAHIKAHADWEHDDPERAPESQQDHDRRKALMLSFRASIRRFADCEAMGDETGAQQALDALDGIMIAYRECK